MQKLRYNLPPLHSLVTFEAAARHLSFTIAASELNVTRVAVSQQIKALEEWLGVELFQRLHRSLKLTEAGERYHDVVSVAFERLLRGTRDLQQVRDDNAVTLTTTTGFSSLWLLPHIGEFREQRLDINLRLLISDDYLDLGRESVDVAIRYGDYGSDVLNMTKLAQQYIFPVASREFVQRHGLPAQPLDLLRLPLIHLDGRYDVQTSWAWWFKRQDLVLDAARPSITVNNYLNQVQAVLDGQGVALMGLPLLHHHMEEGRIVRLMDIPPVKCRAFYLAVPRDPAPSVATQIFCSWIEDRMKEEVKADLKRYRIAE